MIFLIPPNVIWQNCCYIFKLALIVVGIPQRQDLAIKFRLHKEFRAFELLWIKFFFSLVAWCRHLNLEYLSVQELIGLFEIVFSLAPSFPPC